MCYYFSCHKGFRGWVKCGQYVNGNVVWSEYMVACHVASPSQAWGIIYLLINWILSISFVILVDRFVWKSASCFAMWKIIGGYSLMQDSMIESAICSCCCFLFSWSRSFLTDNKNIKIPNTPCTHTEHTVWRVHYSRETQLITSDYKHIL